MLMAPDHVGDREFRAKLIFNVPLVAALSGVRSCRRRRRSLVPPDARLCLAPRLRRFPLGRLDRFPRLRRRAISHRILQSPWADKLWCALAPDGGHGMHGRAFDLGLSVSSHLEGAVVGLALEVEASRNAQIYTF